MKKKMNEITIAKSVQRSECVFDEFDAVQTTIFSNIFLFSFLNGRKQNFPLECMWPLSLMLSIIQRAGTYSNAFESEGVKRNCYLRFSHEFGDCLPENFRTDIRLFTQNVLKSLIRPLWSRNFKSRKFR